MRGSLRDAGLDQCPERGPSTLVGSSSEAESVFHWTWDGGEAEGAEVALDLEDGVHVIMLEVTSTTGATARDVVVVEVGGETLGCGGCAAMGRSSRPGALVLFLVALMSGRRRC